MIDPFIGKTISRYEIVEHIGRGATADVYKAYQATLDRYVAIKLLHPFLAEDTDFLGRFQREAKAAARLRHPNIIQVYDFDVIQDVYYLVMEFIDGITLKTAIQGLSAQQQVMALDEAVRVARCVATALAYAHSRDMIHRDIKPANIMLDREGQVMLADFGTAKILSGGQHTASGVTTGTPAYASPEQVMALPGDRRSDIYSLGVVFFQMVTGQLPYDADTGVAVFLKHLTDPIPSPRAINPALSLDVETVVFRAMAKKAEQRYQTADEFIADLDRISGGHTVSEQPARPLDTTPLDIDRYLARFAGEPSAIDTPLSATPGSANRAPAATPPLDESFQLPPYTLSPGNAITEPHELPAACYLDWARAVNHFTRGYITSWLREGVTRLRAAHQHGLADDLEVIASGAEGLIQRITPGDEFARNTALEEFLLSLGATPPTLHVSPDRLEAAPLGTEETGEPLTVIITNREHGYLFGQVVSQVTWLTAETQRFGCAAGEHCTINLLPNAHGLSAGRIETGAAISVRSIGGDKRLPGRIDILPAILQTDTPSIEFGVVGQGALSTATVTLTNRGQGWLLGELRSQYPWLTLQPVQFQLASRDSLTVTATADPQTLPLGAAAFDHAVIIDSNGGQQILGANLRVRPPRLRLEPETIDLGTLDLAVSRTPRTADLKISNSGLGVLMGVLTSDTEWLTVQPTAFRCATNETQIARVITGKLRTGTYQRAVHLISNAGDATLKIDLDVIFSLEPETVLIPAGPFKRGSKGRNEDEPATNSIDPHVRNSKDAPLAEQPQREVVLSAYGLGKYPVTNAQYAAFVTALNRRPPAHWIDAAPPPGLEHHPVVNLTWNDAAAYCMWLSDITGKTYRLPTEAQWEKAARGPATGSSDGRLFPWGNRWDRTRCNTLESGVRQTTPIGSYSPDGDSGYGCVDLAGNVWEWALDW
ncbi:MAG: SUMF1/EgtB/PvdO family nonheme iron enzyme, partial [Chloroflexi bacterium]|nr:SUMF1/EgtB/PvdO family nonheme iron enzyme [Chloroflexota bacterium]